MIRLEIFVWRTKKLKKYSFHFRCSDLVPYIGVVSNIDTIYETYPQYRKSNGWIYYKAYASSDSSYIDGYETSNGYGEQTKQGHFVAPQFRQKQNGTWGAWTSYILSSDLAGRLILNPTSTGIQSPLSGNTTYRLQIGIDGGVTIWKSINSGETWSVFKTL